MNNYKKWQSIFISLATIPFSMFCYALERLIIAHWFHPLYFMLGLILTTAFLSAAYICAKKASQIDDDKKDKMKAFVESEKGILEQANSEKKEEAKETKQSEESKPETAEETSENQASDT